jgi:hypothetical protein
MMDKEEHRSVQVWQSRKLLISWVIRLPHRNVPWLIAARQRQSIASTMHYQKPHFGLKAR